MDYFQLEENIEKQELNIVFIGSFNPVIVTPFWLSGKSLIRESDATSAKIKIVHSEIVRLCPGLGSDKYHTTKISIKNY